MGRKKGDKKVINNLPNGPRSNRKHGLAGLMETYYNQDIEVLIERAELPQEMQRLINQRMEIFKQQSTFNEVTEGLFKRLAFKEAWCDLAERWFFTNKLSAFWISKERGFTGSYLAMQYKIFSESLARDYDKLGLLPQKGKGFNPYDFASAMQEISGNRK